MDIGQQSLKRASQIGLAALGILLAGAIIFFKERLFFADPSYIVFHIINGNIIAVQNNRYGSFITQIVPYIGLKLHLPLRALLIGYALSFNVFFLLVALIIVCRYKQSGLAVLMALYYFLFVSDSYFLLNDEVHQGTAWLFLFFAVIFYLGRKKANIFLLLVPFLLLSFLAVSSHFIVIISISFLWLYFIIEKKNWPFSKNNTILFSVLLAAVIAFKFLVSQSMPYENQNLKGALHFSAKDLLCVFSTPVIRIFLYRCLINYWIAVVLFIAGIIYMVRYRQLMLAAWTVISCLGYLVLMGLAYRSSDSSWGLFHVETEWTSLGIIIAAPFVFTVLPTLKPSQTTLLLSIIFIVRLSYIAGAIPTFTWRTEFKERVMARMRQKDISKLALYMDESFRPKCVLDWAFPNETLLESGLNGDKPQITFFLLNRDDKATIEAIKNPKGYFDIYSVMPTGELNSKYYSIDTVHPYQIMTYDEFFK